jgi:hypothetical protein
MQETVKPLNRDHLSVLVAILLLANVLFRFIELPEQVWRLQVFGSPLEIAVTGTSLLITLMVGLICTGTNLILHEHPHVGRFPERPIYLSWILPGAMAGLAAYLLSRAPTWGIWVGGLILMAVGISLAIAAEYVAFSPDAPGYSMARLTLNMLAYLLSFVLFTIIYQTRSRSLITATTTTFIALLLALDLLSVADAPLRRILLFTGVVGLVIGESTWALNYWRISTWVGGVFLLSEFYILVNLAHQHLLERLSTSILLEFGVVILVVLIIVLLRIL